MKKTGQKKVINLQNIWITLNLTVYIVYFFLSKVGIGHDLLNYLTQKPGLFDDFFNPLVNAMSKPVLSSSVLQDPSFNSPFTPFNMYFYRVLGAFSFPNPYAFAIFYLGIVLFLIILSGQKFLRGKKELYILLSSYPFIFALSRGNVSLFMLFILFLALKSIHEQRWFQATLLLSFMTAFQFPYAIFFILIPIYCNKYFKPLLLGVLTSISFYILPFFVIGKGFRDCAKTFLALNERWIQTYLTENNGIFNGVSFYGGLKSLFLIIFGNANSQSQLTIILNYLNILYLPTLIILMTFLAFNSKILKIWKIRIENEEFKSYLSVIIALIFVGFPQVSALYKMIFIIPFVLQIKTLYEPKNRRMLYLFVALFLPKDFLHFSIPIYGPGVTLTSIVNPVLMLILIIQISNKLKNFSKIITINDFTIK